MLVVKLEIWPMGDGRQRRELARMLIGNVGTDETGTNYAVDYNCPGSLDRTLEPHYAAGEIRISDRRKASPWHLVAIALAELMERKDERQSTASP